ncbi:MAG: tetraacyldisaccharide 4'-kinase [Flavobacteriales bacterium]|nr:tetraacyldisaccharide 4'-kinase [Flavobacteriales bacterium]
MKSLRFLLFPFAFIYLGITSVRNLFYNLGIFKTLIIPKKSICVGNLSVGGTGKTPHVSYLAELLSESVETTILSRGYGRNTSGFLWVNSKSKASDVGDEPLFYTHSFNEKVHVAVCEKRAVGVQKIYETVPENELIILDDAFQHRAVKAGLNILITDFNKPFSSDYLMPVGTLRESRSGKNRADIIIVSKTPSNCNESIKNQIIKSLNFNPDSIFFSQISYEPMIPFGKKIESFKKVILVTGIANPKPLVEFISKQYEVEEITFGDHHAFSSADILRIHQKFDTFASDETIILTTEKDYMRLKDYTSEWNLQNYPWYFQPITIEIENEKQFKNLINQYVNTI